MRHFILSQVGITMVLAMLCFHCSGQTDQASDEVISLGLPYLHDKKICQDLFIKNGNIKVAAITITCIDVTKEDSTQVYSINIPGSKSKRKEVFYSNLHLSTKDKGSTFHSLYRKIILNNYSLPAGTYHTYLTLQLKNNRIIKKAFIQHVDSLLSENAAARKEFDNIYNPPGKTFLGVSLSRLKPPPGAKNVRSAIKRSSGK
jgi:hypothetical protein